MPDNPLPVEVKTVGQLIDDLCIANLKIWHLVDRARQGEKTAEVMAGVEHWNDTRTELIRAIDRRLGGRDIGGKVFGGPKT